MNGKDAAIEALGEVIAAYKTRIAELEGILSSVQETLERERAERESD